MSVVGLTFGIAAKASRPTTASAASAATSASTRAGGFSRSYQPKPAARASASSSIEAACQLTAPPPQRGAAPERGRTLLGQQRRAVGHAGDLGREVAAAAEDLGRRPVGDQLALTEQHDPVREGGGELGVVGRDDTAAPAPASSWMRAVSWSW